MFLEIKGIKKAYGQGENRAEVLKGIDIEIQKGEICVLLGPSGSGKSTLLNIIGGIDNADEGYISINGEKIADMNEKQLTLYRRKHLGYVFQMYNLIPNLNIKENVEVGAYLSDNPLDVDELLNTLGLYEHRHKLPNQLSGGQQQRVAFARAIVIEPQCILFDEPLSALDALLREQMRSELKELISRLGITAVFVTHDQTEAMSMSDMIAVMSEGAVEQYDAPEKVYSSPASEFAARFVGASNWIDKRSMFRPESASDVPVENAVRFDTTVRSVQFLGGAYQIMLDCCGEKWSFLSSKRMSVGNTLPIYINKNNIITV